MRRILLSYYLDTKNINFAKVHNTVYRVY